MALSFAKIRIKNGLIVAEKGYDPFVGDDTCLELIAAAQKLHLGNLKHIPCVLNVIFNQSQCREILEKEIPVLRVADLSLYAQKAVDGLESALKDITDEFSYLLLEGD